MKITRFHKTRIIYKLKFVLLLSPFHINCIIKLQSRRLHFFIDKNIIYKIYTYTSSNHIHSQYQ